MLFFYRQKITAAVSTTAEQPRNSVYTNIYVRVNGYVGEIYGEGLSYILTLTDRRGEIRAIPAPFLESKPKLFAKKGVYKDEPKK